MVIQNLENIKRLIPSLILIFLFLPGYSHTQTNDIETFKIREKGSSFLEIENRGDYPSYKVNKKVMNLLNDSKSGRNIAIRTYNHN